MQNALAGVENVTFQMDDILIHPLDVQSHIQKVRKVLGVEGGHYNAKLDIPRTFY